MAGQKTAEHGKKRQQRCLYRTPPTMEKRLRNKFVLTAMLSLFIIVVLIIAILNILNFVQIRNRADHIIEILNENNGEFPAPDGQNNPPSPRDPQPRITSWISFLRNDFTTNRDMEAPFETRYFYAIFDADGNETTLNTEHVAAITDETAKAYAGQARTGNREKAFLGGYRCQVIQKDGGQVMVIFVDCSSDLAGAGILLNISIFIGVIALALMFVLVQILAGITTAPVVESLEKQKRFISDAGHELKTPLTIISANVDVLEMVGTKNEWTGSIRNQVRRMTALITNMLTLTRMEEDASRELYTTLNLSEIAKEAAKNYETVAAARGKTLKTSIQDGIPIFGEQRSMEQLMGLLLDNAMKYSAPKSVVFFSLSQDRKIRLLVENACTKEALPEGNLDRLFDRFYRTDASRTGTGSFGIGLSAARAICQGHGGTITAERVGEASIRFTVLLPPAKPVSRGKALPSS